MPDPLDLPSTTDGRVAVIETLLDIGEAGDDRRLGQLGRRPRGGNHRLRRRLLHRGQRGRPERADARRGPAFHTDYADHRPAAFNRPSRAAAAAAATWVLAYNARCDLSQLTVGEPAPAGSARASLERHGDDYLTLPW